MRRVATLAALVGGLTATWPAAAFERQWHLGGGVGTGAWPGVAGSGAPFGEKLRAPLLGAHLGYGISDMFDARLELTWARHSLDGQPEAVDPELDTTDVLTVAAGVAYKVDIIQWVPSVGVLAGYTFFMGGPGVGENSQPDPDLNGGPSLSVTLGLDYAVSRDWAIGIQLRYHGLLVTAPDSLSDAAYFTGLLRFEHTWGF